MYNRNGMYRYILSKLVVYFFFQAEDGIRDLVRSRGLGDVYKRQDLHASNLIKAIREKDSSSIFRGWGGDLMTEQGVDLSLIHI